MWHRKGEKNILGEKGEEEVCKYLKKKGFKIIERNYWKKWGEIDVIAKKNDILHFMEVKTVSLDVSYETSFNNYRPEDNLHPWKLQRLSRVIQTYLMEKDIENEWVFDVATVYFDKGHSKGHRLLKVELLEDLVL